ncbi:MAG: hypothetical protein MI784_02850 [Cytophagales bacterium]|nr:hypothetical protein [Cytophagales bacterium]
MEFENFETLSCDFIHFSEIISSLKKNPNQKSKADQLIELFEKDLLISLHRNEWLDEKISLIITDTISLLIRFLQNNHSQLNDNYIIKAADLILQIDELEDQALKFKLLSLNRQKQHAKMHSEFERFTKKYESLYNETYPLGLMEILEKKEKMAEC